MRWKTWFALLCALLMLAQSCLAFSDTADALDRADAVTVRIGGLAIEQLNGSEGGLRVLQDFAGQLGAEAALRGDTARLGLTAGETEIASVMTDSAAAGILPHEALARVFDTALPALFDACLPAEPEEIPEPEKRNASVKNLPRSTQRTTLSITPEQFAATDFLEELKACAAVIGAHLPHIAEVTAWLDQAAAANTLTLKRLEDETGKPIAWQLTGRLMSGGKDTRQMTLYGGISGRNAYVSLKLPARSGRNDLQLVISLKETAGKRKDTWSGTLSYKRVINGESYSVKDTLDLTDEHQEGEEISGTVKREETAGGIKTVWTLTPELTGDGQSLRGTLNVKKKHAQTQVWQAALTLSITAGADDRPASCGDTVSFAAALAGWLDGYRSGLSPADQRQLDHMLRSDAWLNGPVSELP